MEIVATNAVASRPTSRANFLLTILEIFDYLRNLYQTISCHFKQLSWSILDNYLISKAILDIYISFTNTTFLVFP